MHCVVLVGFLCRQRAIVLRDRASTARASQSFLPLLRAEKRCVSTEPLRSRSSMGLRDTTLEHTRTLVLSIYILGRNQPPLGSSSGGRDEEDGQDRREHSQPSNADMEDTVGALYTISAGNKQVRLPRSGRQLRARQLLGDNTVVYASIFTSRQTSTVLLKQPGKCWLQTRLTLLRLARTCESMN